MSPQQPDEKRQEGILPEELSTFEVEEADLGGDKKRHRGIYLLPNLITTGALFAGFYAVIAAMNGKYEYAAIAICIAGIMDGFDGTVARLTNTQSAFGAQYDSMSDLIAFGAAPALVSYAWSIHALGKPGWMCAFIFTACAAMRLARFNVQLDVADKRIFTGLPSPSAAGLVATMVWLGADMGIKGEDWAWFAASITALAGILMVSNVRYRSFKEFHIGRVPFAALFGFVILFAIIFLDPPKVLFGIAACYCISGPILALWSRRHRSLPSGETRH